MRRSILWPLILLPLVTRPDTPLEIRRFDHQASNAVVSCSYRVDWPVGGVSTQVLEKLRFTLLAEGWATPDHQARKTGDNPNAHLVRRAGLFAEGRIGLDEELGEPSAAWEERAEIESMGACASLLVFKSMAYEYTGGAHGNSSVNFLVFDAQGGLIPPTAWFTAGSDAELSKRIEAGFRKQNNLAPDAPLSANGFFEDRIPRSATLRPMPEGMVFFYNSYEIACYADGQPTLILPWADLLDLLTPANREWLKGLLP